MKTPAPANLNSGVHVHCASQAIYRHFAKLETLQKYFSRCQQHFEQQNEMKFETLIRNLSDLEVKEIFGKPLYTVPIFLGVQNKRVVNLENVYFVSLNAMIYLPFSISNVFLEFFYLKLCTR